MLLFVCFFFLDCILQFDKLKSHFKAQCIWAWICRHKHNACGLIEDTRGKKKKKSEQTNTQRDVGGPLICTRIISSNPQPKITKFELCTCALYSKVTIFIKVKEINHLD